MPEYSTCSRFSLVQLRIEERKQQAHLKKIDDMQHHNGLDNSEPLRFPHIHEAYIRHMNTKHHAIDKENETKLKKLVEIMMTKAKQPPSSSTVLFPSVSPNRRHRAINTPENNTEYLERVAKAKGKYDVRAWRKEFERHQEYLKIRKDNSVFTPLGMGFNRQRSFKMNSMINSKQTTPTSSKINIRKQND
ncbi:unnamed protein product [Rotaria socialis]|uniref:Uncharacterized protein n=1 Tax=Rotaria socialis TaxID=392032 RepID=A0A818C7Q1_9BILA|nr:unnamed protein product [Rotaria socialis]CAF4318321.1 unnamed protein product [Rotaria socialis]